MNAICPKCGTSTNEPTCPECGFCISCFLTASSDVVVNLKKAFPKASNSQIRKALDEVRNKYQVVKE